MKCFLKIERIEEVFKGGMESFSWMKEWIGWSQVPRTLLCSELGTWLKRIARFFWQNHGTAQLLLYIHGITSFNMTINDFVWFFWRRTPTWSFLPFVTARQLWLIKRTQWNILQSKNAFYYVFIASWLLVTQWKNREFMGIFPTLANDERPKTPNRIDL